MEPLPLAAVLGLTALFAAASTAVVATIGLARGRLVPVQLLALSFATLFFVGLTQLPLPDPALLKMQCPVLGTEPDWMPFHTAARIAEDWQAHLAHPNWLPLHVISMGPSEVEYWQRDWVSHAFLRGSWFLPAAMNLAICIPIGALLVGYVDRAQAALAAGLSLSLLIELTQLTGTWAIFPCAYRKFDADDLILNALGVLLGFVAARRLPLVARDRVPLVAPPHRP